MSDHTDPHRPPRRIEWTRQRKQAFLETMRSKVEANGHTPECNAEAAVTGKNAQCIESCDCKRSMIAELERELKKPEEA